MARENGYSGCDRRARQGEAQRDQYTREIFYKGGHYENVAAGQGCSG